MCTKHWLGRLGVISLSRKSVDKLIDRPDMTIDVYRRRKTTAHNKNKQKQSVNRASYQQLGHTGLD